MRSKTISAWGDFGVAVAIFAAASLVGGGALVALRAAIQGIPEVILTMTGHSVLFVCAIVAAGAYYRNREENRPLFRSPFRWFSAPLTILGIVLISAAGVVLEPLLNLFPESYFADFSKLIGSGFWSIVMTVVLAPVLEEIFFRGLILEQLRRRIPVWQAVVASALFFGAVHLPNVPQAINAVMMAVIMGYIYVLSGSLMSVIVVHAVNNGIAYLVLEMTGTQSTDIRAMIGNDPVYWIVFAVSAAVVVTAFVFFARAGAGTGTKIDNKTLQKDGENQ